MTQQTHYISIPLGTQRAWLVWVLLGINIVIFLATIIISNILLFANNIPVPGSMGIVLSPVGGVLRMFGWKENNLILQGEYWRLISAMFLHGSIMHMAFNGFAIYALGPEAERIYGSARFFAMYLLSGIAGGIASYTFSSNPSVGASGAIFGLIGALGVFFYVNRHILSERGREQFRTIIGIIIINIIIGLNASGVIDNYAHIGGLVGGIASGFMVVPHYIIERDAILPRIVRVTPPAGWFMVAALFLLLCIITRIVTPA